MYEEDENLDDNIEVVEGQPEDQVGETQAEDQGPASFSFGDEDQPEDQPEETSLVKQLRKELRDRNRELKRYQVHETPKPVEVGPRPTYEGCNYDEQAFEAAIEEWTAKKIEAEREQENERRAQEDKNREGNAILAEYNTRSKAFAASNAIDDYDDAFADVEDNLGPEKTALLIAGSPKAEQLIYALHKNPKKMQALAGIGNLPRFMYEAAMLEKDMKTTRKSPPADTPVRGNASSASGDRRLAQLEAEAHRTGDRSKLIAYKRQMNK